jgi:hypothetical protein
MATSKTGSFWLTETIDMTTDATPVQGTIDLGAYVDVGDQQALAIEQVDFIWQRHNTAADTYSAEVEQAMGANGVVEAQLSDLNPGTEIVVAGDNSLIASGALHVDDQNYILTHASDFYPDNFGKLDESRIVVNDQLYLVALMNATAVANNAVSCTIKIKSRIVKLSTKDWMAIAIQSTAADN